MAHQAKDLEIGFLLDFYGELLSDSRREAAELYYNEDLSLAEIAETAGITRQGVRDSIAKARVQLTGYEEKLGLAAKFRAIENGRYLVRSANTGVSSIVGPDGEVLGEQAVLTTGLVSADVYARSNTTPYTQVGYMLVWISFAAQIALIFAQIAYVLVRRFKHQKNAENS